MSARERIEEAIRVVQLLAEDLPADVKRYRQLTTLARAAEALLKEHEPELIRGNVFPDWTECGCGDSWPCPVLTSVVGSEKEPR